MHLERERIWVKLKDEELWVKSYNPNVVLLSTIQTCICYIPIKTKQNKKVKVTDLTHKKLSSQRNYPKRAENHRKLHQEETWPFPEDSCSKYHNICLRHTFCFSTFKNTWVDAKLNYKSLPWSRVDTACMWISSQIISTQKEYWTQDRKPHSVFRQRWGTLPDSGLDKNLTGGGSPVKGNQNA